MGFIGQDTIVFIRKKGNHYHLANCWMVKDISMADDPYFGIEFKDVDKRQYQPCACASDKRK